MRHRWWYAKIPKEKRMPDYPHVDMALTKFASDKAKLSYQKYYDLGIFTTFYMSKGEVEEEDWDIFDREEANRLQEIYDSYEE